MEREIRFPGLAPGWEVIRDRLVGAGEPVTLRMIDNQPAFPDEVPEPTWQELRIGTATGMVTLRKGDGHFRCLVWGNADAGLKRSWDQVCWACAAAGDGVIEADGETYSADAFRLAMQLSHVG
jgi:hypothetical protein